MERHGNVIVVRANEPDYAKMKGLEALGKAIFLGERYNEDGILSAAFGNPSSYRDNPEISIGGEFFMSALRDYRDWKEKWWREAIQNAVDATATKIHCEAIRNDDNTWAISVSDNGVGMDEETILTKFLVLGASGKKGQEGAVGGFGKAKELLLLPWIIWEVESNDTRIKGQGIKYEVQRRQFKRGTTLTVIMPPDRYTTGLQAENFIKKCYLPNIEFSITRTPDKPIGASIKPEMVRVFADLNPTRNIGNVKMDEKIVGSVHYDPDRQALVDQRMMIRANGIYMFDKYLPNEAKGTLTFDITAKTVDILTANRDDFRAWEVGSQIDNLISVIVKDVRSALQDKTGMIRKKFKGSGRFVGTRRRDFQALLERRLLGSEESMESAETGNQVIMVPVHHDPIEQDVRQILERPVHAPAADEPGPRGFFQNFTVPPEAIEAMIQILVNGPAHIEAAAIQLAWQPDYFIVNNASGYRIPREFFPETMSARNMKLIRFWAELCRFVLIQLNCSTPYGVGVAIDPKSAGLHIQDEDGHWLLFNPFLPKEDANAVDPTSDRMYDLHRADDVFTLYAVAVHECTHMADDLTYHDETFSTALTYNFAKTSGKDRQIRAILKAVKERRPKFAPNW